MYYNLGSQVVCFEVTDQAVLCLYIQLLFFIQWQVGINSDRCAFGGIDLYPIGLTGNFPVAVAEPVHESTEVINRIFIAIRKLLNDDPAR